MESTFVLFRSVGVCLGLIGELESDGLKCEGFVSSIQFTKYFGGGYDCEYKKELEMMVDHRISR